MVGYIEIAKSPVATAHDEGVAQPSPPVTVAERASHADASHATRAGTPRRSDGPLRTRAEAEGPCT